MDGNYCSSSECSSFSSFLSLVPSTSALTLPTITPLVGSGTSAVIFDFCFSVSANHPEDYTAFTRNDALWAERNMN